MRNFLLLVAGLFLFATQAFSQTRTITGTVTDEGGKPIPNASVMVKGVTIGTSTNNDGFFTLNVPDNKNVLVVSAIGLGEKEVTIGSTNNLSITLSQYTSDMDEVVVMAYGNQRRGEIVGSVAKIGSAKIEDRVTTNITQALAGAAPGISATSGLGQPGAGATIRIRGFGSISGSNDPLYVVDGVPYSGFISDINPADIESISLLKDPSSAALYGARAANGVVMITTKKGKLTDARITVNGSTGFSGRGIKEYETIKTNEYYPAFWEAYKNSLVYSGTPLTESAAAIKASNEIANSLIYNPYDVAKDKIVGIDGKLNPDAKLLYNDFDWFTPLIRRGPRNDYSVSVAGGQKKTDYYVSLNYLNDQGYIINSDFKRYSGRINVNSQVKGWLKIGLNLSGTSSSSNLATATSDDASSIVNPFLFARRVGSIYPVKAYDATGKPVLKADGTQYYDYGLHPGAINRPQGGLPGRHVLYETMLNSNITKRNGMTGRTYAEFKFLNDFTFTTNASIDVVNRFFDYFQNKIVGDGVTAGGYASKSSDITQGVTLNQLLNYNKEFGVHQFDVLVGHESFAQRNYGLDGNKRTQIVEGNIELPNFVVLGGTNSYVDNYRTEGYFSRLNYNFDKRYLFTGSVRRDGSSRFSPQSRWGTFYSLGGAWNIAQESFLKNYSWINDLKLRASYGEVGNDNLGSFYQYQAFYSIGSEWNNASEPGLIMSSIATPDLAWEVNKTFNVGLDFAIIKNRLSGTIEFFKRGSSNLLFEVPLGLSSPVTVINKNIGTMWNKGVEINLVGDIIKTTDARWNLELNWTSVKNKITKMPEETPTIIDGTKQLKVGYDRYAFWLRDWYGVDSKDGSGLFYAKPGTTGSTLRIINGDSLTTSPTNARYSYFGTAIPKFFGSINNTFTYKNISLSVLLNYQVGGKFYDGVYQTLMSPAYGSSLHKDVLQSWHKEGDLSSIPRLDMAGSANFNSTSSRWLIDASYLNFRNATLTYKLPAKVMSNIGIYAAKVFIAGENLALLSKRQGMNPAESFSGVNTNVYIPNRVISLGANVTF